MYVEAGYFGVQKSFLCTGEVGRNKVITVVFGWVNQKH